MKKEKEKVEPIYNASEMKEISEKYAPLKVSEHVEATFEEAMRRIMAAATEGKRRTVLLMDPFATDNDKVANRVRARCQNLGYVAIYHQDFGTMEFQW